MQIYLLIQSSAVKLLHVDVLSPRSSPDTSRTLFSFFELLLNSFEGLRLP